jgi:hypothetical protein
LRKRTPEGQQQPLTEGLEDAFPSLTPDGRAIVFQRGWGTGRANLSQRLTKLLGCRSTIEPVIGYTKHDHGMERNHLLGETGDRINAMLSGCAENLRKLWREFVENPRPCTII